MMTMHHTTVPQMELPAGVPMKSARTASTMKVTGFASATGCSQSGIDAIGTNADEMKVSGKMIVNPYPFAASGEEATSPMRANTQEKTSR